VGVQDKESAEAETSMAALGLELPHARAVCIASRIKVLNISTKARCRSMDGESLPLEKTLSPIARKMAGCKVYRSRLMKYGRKLRQ
jgi:hypothetical protein